jgi:hypothetical protein
MASLFVQEQIALHAAIAQGISPLIVFLTIFY